MKQLPKNCEFANANLLHKPDGYYLCITTYVNKENLKSNPKNGKDIGLDFGIKTTITTSECEKIDISIGESDQIKAL
jgi:transposase